jgi:aldose 1-epimerase
MKTKKYGTTTEGRDVEQYTLMNKAGLTVRCINYGCRLTHILVPGKDGPVDVLLGFDALADYERDGTFQGTFVGRYANRIAGAAFALGSRRYELLKNDGNNYLHGSWHRRVFGAEVLSENSLLFTYTSPDGEDGFPGEVRARVQYTLTEENTLEMDYRAVSDAETYVNFTNHSYFNLSGAGSGSVYEHLLRINSREILEAGGELCPTGRVLNVADGPFDFTSEKPIGRDIAVQDPQLIAGGGYDHCYLLAQKEGDALLLAAELGDPTNTRGLRVYTTQPSVQLYTGNFLVDGTMGKNGRSFGYRGGVCLETQHYPDTPSHPEFPSALLKPGEEHHEKTALQFFWK